MNESAGARTPFEATRVWLEVLTDAVDLLLRQSERSAEREAERAFASGSAGAVLVVQTEQARIREARSRLRALRAGGESKPGDMEADARPVP